MAASAGDGPIDIEALIRAVADGKALTGLPRRTIPTLSHGVQLLVDRSEAMLPFHLDVAGIERELVQLVGSGNVEVLHFVACPSRGCGRGIRRRWKPYGVDTRPRPGMRVLCVTDLGIGSTPFGSPPARLEEWKSLADEVHRAGCSVGALVPYPPERWPPELGRVLELFYWDRPMTVAHAVRGLRLRR